jgi:hypothetical protein
MMTSLQRCVVKQLCGEREGRFFSCVLNHLTEISGEFTTDLESWMVTSFAVEFGVEIGSIGL